MDARHPRGFSRIATMLALAITILNCQQTSAQLFPGHRLLGPPPSAQTARPIQPVGTQNFIVFASSTEWATQVAEAAEQYRKDLAMYWLGHELPAWGGRCPLHVTDGPGLAASGETQYQIISGSAGGWMMSVHGTRERILDSVLPHEITHTIFATHFAPLNEYMPRWADEGACTTIEHEAEKSKHRKYLEQFLRTGRGLAFNRMFQLKDYPKDIMPLYAQGHSVVQFLISQSGPQRFIEFVYMGMETSNWTMALRNTYAYQSIGELQLAWNRWLADGSPQNLVSYSPLLQQSGTTEVQLASAASPIESNAQPQGILASIPVGQSIASTASDNSPSWYQRRLTEVTGQQPPKYDGRPQGKVRSGDISNHRNARPMDPQGVQVNVQSWGAAGRVPGIESPRVGQPPYHESAASRLVPIVR